MNCMEDLLEEIVNEMKKEIPADVIKDLEELSRLEAEVHSSMIHSRIIDTGKVKRINELVRKHYYHGDQDRTEETAQPVKTFDFGEAIRRLKKGACVARKGWNGKEQYIELATELSYWVKSHGSVINVDHEDIGSKAIAFVGTRGIQVGWLASQADMLAEDWYEVKG